MDANQKIILMIRMANSYEAARRDVARDPCAPSWLLAQLAHDVEPRVQETVAENPHTDALTLDILAREDNSGIKRAVAANPNTSPETLTLLARNFTFAVLRNPNCPAWLKVAAKVDCL